MEKTCKTCNQTKSIDAFYKDKGLKDGHANNCKVCRDIKTDQWRKSNNRKYNADMRAYNKKRYHRLRLQRYKLLPEQYAKMLEEQNHACKLCHKKAPGKRPLAIDHNHSTGKVRGLLCYACNRAIAILDSSNALTAAIAYIKE